MDLSHTRKRNRDDDSSDEEQTALKKLPLPLSSPENHDEDKAKSSDLSAQSAGSTACPPTARSLDGASSATTASTSEAHEGAAQTVPASLLPVESSGAATAEDSSTDTTAPRAKSTLTATQDPSASDCDDMKDCAAKRKSTRAAPPTAADFLKTAQARAPARKAKKRSKGKKPPFRDGHNSRTLLQSSTRQANPHRLRISRQQPRNRDDDSSDEEQTALKKLPVPLSSPENHDEDKAKSSDLSAQSGGSTACPPTARSLDGASSATTASTSEAHEGAAQTVPASLLPVESSGAATAEDSSTDTTAPRAKSTLTATQDPSASDCDDMEEDHEAEDCAAKRKSTRAAPPTAADFLKTAQARAPARKAKKRSRGKKATRQQQAPATQAEEDFKEACSKAASRRARKLASAALPVDSAVVGTVLFKPSAPGGSFQGSLRLTLAQLLALTELRGIAVKARQPADRLTSIGYLHGVDGEPDNASLLSGLQSTLSVLSATREGSTVTLRFAGPVPPQHVKLFLVRFPMRPARPRLLQCRQCGRFGHAREACNWPDGLHQMRTCPPGGGDMPAPKIH
ncbi:nucleolar and coiled-body phosphoprotein 1-like [Rhipicephalus sanguineus]|uniref:nucleolar and coiled-body phosphoprotein 1-like n=1 Tax=Rhipicephalus sanguineus TaxID=34632 RepID=UPI0020C59980|nr:nucleolar and coiled-body phosphoprotein 1-like [Rhipicephalus sanguineus]